MLFHKIFRYNLLSFITISRPDIYMYVCAYIITLSKYFHNLNETTVEIDDIFGKN